MDSEDGELFIKQLATFVRTHEKALANALQLRRQNLPRHGASQSVSSVPTAGLTTPTTVPERPSTATASSSNGLAAALSFGSLNFTSQTAKSAKLALTPHHLFYLLSRFEELKIPVGPMKVRLENLHDTSTSANYVSFLGQSQREKTRNSDVGSIRSVSSIRSVMSGMSALWSNFGIGSSTSASRTERQKAALDADLKYLYSAFTKVPCLRLAPDFRARLIKGYEEFPFDSAVPLHIFKNCQALEVCDIDFRQFFGWDRMADQLRSLTVKRASLSDPADILIDIVLDDMDKRRRRTSKSHSSPTATWPGTASPRRSMTLATPGELKKSTSAPGSPGTRAAELNVGSMGSETAIYHENELAARNSRRASVAVVELPKSPTKSSRPRSHSPRRPASARHGSHHVRNSHKVHRSGSGSSQSSMSDSWHQGRGSTSNLLATGALPASKWRFLRHLSLAENGLVSIPESSLAPLANTLYSLDLSSNEFNEIPDSLASLTALRALNLSKCTIESLHSLTRNPLPAITALNLRDNRLQSLAGVERLYPLERLDLRDNRLKDPVELARLTRIPDIREIWVEGNPFTRTHKDYRITIFNLFRQSPGYTEDVLIDMMGPTYSERKHLVERTQEPAPVPVIKPPVPELKAVDVSKPAIVYENPKEPAVLRKERPAPKVTASEINTSSTRSRRRAPKRRIVDLADSQSHVARQPDENETMGAMTSLDSNYRISQTTEVHQNSPVVVEENRTQSSRGVPRIDTSVVPKLPPVAPTQEIGTPTSWTDSQKWDVGGEMYRRKIEALRNQVGEGYLNVLSEEHWDVNDCPPELRQQILGYILPDDVHNAGIAPRTAPLLPLILTCKAIRLDVLELMRTWSPVYHIEDPAAITNTKNTTTTSRRHLKKDGPHMRSISLRLFAGLDLRRMRSPPVDAVEGVFDARSWLRCVAKLPKRAPAVECVTIDLTPAPAWMAAKRPDWVRGTVLDARNTMFLRGCAGSVRELVAALCESYRGAEVRVSLGGVVPRKARRAVEDMMVVEEGSTAGRGGTFVGFEGEWLSGPSEVPTRLSLALVCRCWGLEVDGPSVRIKDWRYDLRTIQIRNEARKEGLETPDLNLRALSPVWWSRNSCTAYFVNAQEDEGRTREDLVRLLAFAGEMRTEAVQQDAVVNFAPAIRERRFLLHCLAKDLGLASVSVGDAGEKFVRVSQVVEVAADEHQLPDNSEGCDGGGNEEEGDLEVHGEEDSTSSSHRVTRLRRPCRSCCAWGPIERLLRAPGDR